MSSLRTALFLNAHSRQARKIYNSVVDDFVKKQKKFEIVEVIVVKNLKQMDYHLDVLKSIKQLDCVIVGSGDGTIVAVLNALRDRDITYGFLPLGTSNTFIRSLGLPLAYPRAKDVILKQQAKAASLGVVNGILFANIAGVGVPSKVTENLSNRVKRFLGPFAYIVSGVKALVKHPAFYCHITNDEINEGFYTHYLLLANGKYHGNIPLGKEVSAYNDQLMLIAFGTSTNRLHNVQAMLSLLFRRHQKDKRVRMIPFASARITTQPRRNIEADGEVISRTPATVEIKKNAIKVFTKV